MFVFTQPGNLFRKVMTKSEQENTISKTPKMRKKILLTTLPATLLTAILLLGFSYSNPGRYYFLDVVRIPIQSTIMATAGDIIVGDYYIPMDAIVPSQNALFFGEIEPYLRELQTGDVFFTHSERYISSRIIPGKWKHSGIYLGSREQVRSFFGRDPQKLKLLEAYYQTGNELLILDSSNEGVAVREVTRLSNLHAVSLLLGFSAYRINRDQADILSVFSYAMEQLGKPYDYDLLLDDSRAVYCSELLYHGLSRIGIELSLSEPVVGRNVVSPNMAVEYIQMFGIPAGEFTRVLLLEKEDGKINNLVSDHLSMD